MFIQTNRIELTDGSELATLEILRVGSFDSPTHGKFSITKEMLKSVKDNFYSNIYRLADNEGRPQLPLNFAHDKGREAAGWIRELYLSEDEKTLIGKIEMTPTGKEKVINKEFAFASAEISFKHYDPELKRNFNNVLTGAALTNIPFIKGMKAIELTETYLTMEDIIKSLTEMTPENQVVVFDKLAYLIGKNAPKKEEFSEKEKALISEKEELQNKLALQEKELSFTVMLTEGKVVPAQKEAFLKNDMVEFAKNSSSKINFSQDSNSGNFKEEEKKDLTSDDAVKLIDSLAKGKMKESSISYGAATSLVLSEREDLNKIIKGE
jgi:hypothetical protein